MSAPQPAVQGGMAGARFSRRAPAFKPSAHGCVSRRGTHINSHVPPKNCTSCGRERVSAWPRGRLRRPCDHRRLVKRCTACTSSRRGHRAAQARAATQAGCKRAARRTSRAAVARRDAPRRQSEAVGSAAAAALPRGGPPHLPARSATARPESRARASTRCRQPPPRRCWPPRATAAQQRRRLARAAALLRGLPCRSC